MGVQDGPSDEKQKGRRIKHSGGLFVFGESFLVPAAFFAALALAAGFSLGRGVFRPAAVARAPVLG